MIEIRRVLHAELAFHVLAHLPLLADAASLFDPTLPRSPWEPALTHAYRAAAGRLVLHGLPLWVDDLAGLHAALEAAASPGLDDPAGRRLAEAFRGALWAEHEATVRRYRPDERAADLRDVDSWLRERLVSLRQTLYHPKPPPLLDILDCPALAAGAWTHGRACTRPARRVVAAALHVAPPHALCQILHEEIHAVTDPPLRAAWSGAGQDTRAGAAGFGLHAALEVEAVQRGQALLEAAGPDLLPTYARWRARYGIRPPSG